MPVVWDLAASGPLVDKSPSRPSTSGQTRPL